jgi:hypothetical protein
MSVMGLNQRLDVAYDQRPSSGRRSIARSSVAERGAVITSHKFTHDVVRIHKVQWMGGLDKDERLEPFPRLGGAPRARYVAASKLILGAILRFEKGFI